MKHNFYIREQLSHAIEQRLGQYARGDLIDIGCGTKQYRTMVARYTDSHTGVDHSETQHDKSNIDILATAYDIPDDDNMYDTALCTEVLEHLESPEHAVRECFRVLKRGGYAIYTSPFIWHIHEAPRDFYRYSNYGLRHIFESAGFEIVAIDPLNGFVGTFGQLSVYFLNEYNGGIVRKVGIITAIGWAIQKSLPFLDRLLYRPRWTSHFITVVRKPSP